MAVLSDINRGVVWADIMRRVPIAGLTKAQLRAAVDAADQWAEDNASSFNAALPAAARSALSAKQKAALLMFVINKRHDVT